MKSRLSAERLIETDALAPFTGIPLSALDTRAELLDRLDRKYVVDSELLTSVLEQLQSAFSILDIDGKRSFHYENCYFDNASLDCYWKHQQGRRLRFKVRTRHYVDSNACFVEIKLKGARGKTIKRRLPYDVDSFSELDTRARHFIQQTLQEIYGHVLDFELSPSLRVSFQRITLAANTGHERITIDRCLQFSHDNQLYLLNPDLAIIETKSAGQQGTADRILRGLHQHPTSACSKYCIGLALLGRVPRYNRFLKALRKLRVRPFNLETGIAAANADKLDEGGSHFEVPHVANQN